VTSASLLAFAAAALGAGGIVLLVPARVRAREGSGTRAMRALARLGGGVRSARAPRDLDGRIAAAGAPAGLGPRDVMAAKLAAAALGGASGLVLGTASPGRLGLVLAVAGPVGGFLGPDLWLARLARARVRRVRRELPAMLDLLRVSVGAGLSLQAALAAVGDRARGPLAGEWRAAARQAALGVPLHEALQATARRLPSAEVVALVGALERAMRHGAPLADTLAAQARDARLARRRRIQEEAAKAGPKIQLVVAVLLVPSVLLLVAAALAAALMRSGGGLLPV
jgi:tight adherence protein C